MIYVVDLDSDGNQVTNLAHLTGPQLAKVIWATWSSRKALRLRTSLNRLAEARTGKRSPRAGNGRDNVYRLADVAD